MSTEGIGGKHTLIQPYLSHLITVFLISYSSPDEVAVLLINSTPTRRLGNIVWCLQS